MYCSLNMHDEGFVAVPVPKSEATKKWLVDTLSVYFGFQHLPIQTLERCAEQMKGALACAGWDVILEHHFVHHLFVIQSGTCDVLVGGNVVDTLPQNGHMFGVLALLRQIRSSATIRVTSHAMLWALDVANVLHAVNETQGYVEAFRLMHETRLFRGQVSTTVLRDIAEDMSIRTFQSGERIELHSDYCVLKSGSIEIQSGDKARRISHSGDAFGAIAALSDKRSAETFTAMASTELICIPFASLRVHLAPHFDESMLRAFKLGVLHRIAALRDMDPRLVDRLAGCFSEQIYNDGDELAHEGESWDMLTVVLDGSVMFCRHGREVKLLRAITHFGEDGLKADKRLKNALVASSRGCKNPRGEVRIMTLKRRDYEKVLGNSWKERAHLQAIGDALKALEFDEYPRIRAFPCMGFLGLDLLADLALVDSCIKSYPPGTEISDDNDALYILLAGSATVHADDAGSAQRLVEAPAHFGERALLHSAQSAAKPAHFLHAFSERGEQRRIVATTKTTCSVCTLSRHMVEIYYGPLRALLDSAQARQRERVRLRDITSGVASGALVSCGSMAYAAMGNVWIVRDVSTGRTYARKTLSKRRVYAEGKHGTVHIAVELAHLALESDFLVKVMHGNADASGIHLYLEHVACGDMRQLLRARGRLDERTTAFFAIQVASALTYLHDARIVHRVIRPECILVDVRGYIKLQLDFLVGGCRRLAREGVTYTLCGLPEYMSPEMVSLSGYEFRTDVWSFGVLCYELLCGKTPYRPSTNYRAELYYAVLTKPLDFAAWPPDAPPSSKLRAFLGNVLEKDPRMRPRITDLRTDSWLAQAFTASEMVAIERRALALDGGNAEPFVREVVAPELDPNSDQVLYFSDTSDFDFDIANEFSTELPRKGGRTLSLT